MGPIIAMTLLLGFQPLSQPAVHQETRAINHKPSRYVSPDGKGVAVVKSVKQRFPYGEDPSEVDLFDAHGKLLASRDHSYWPNQGYSVAKASWTKDSRYFVYEVEESGGHSPWMTPIFYFSPASRRFYSVDQMLESLATGSLVTGGLRLKSPCILVTQAKYYGGNHSGLRVFRHKTDPETAYPTIELDLRWAERHLGKAGLSTDAEDRRKAKESE